MISNKRVISLENKVTTIRCYCCRIGNRKYSKTKYNQAVRRFFKEQIRKGYE